MIGKTLGRRAVNAVVVHVLLWIFVVVALIPLVWVAMTSIKLDTEVVTYPPKLFPAHPTLKPYVQLWQKAPFLTYTRNSTIASVGAAALALLISSFAAYGMARFRFRGVRIFLAVFLLSQMFPGSVHPHPDRPDHHQAGPVQYSGRVGSHLHGVFHPLFLLDALRLLPHDPQGDR